MKRPNWLRWPRFTAGGHIPNTPPPGKAIPLEAGGWECLACGAQAWGISWSEIDSMIYDHVHVCPAQAKRGDDGSAS